MNHQTNSKPRNGAVELYRVLLMFGIVFLHSMTFSPYDKPLWLWNLCLSCVDGFVIISGWYGITFAPSKVFRLYGTMLYAACVVFCGLALAGKFADQPLWDVLHWIPGQCRKPWFLNAYLFLMLLAPLVDAVLAKLNNKQLIPVLTPFFILTLCWSGGADMPLIGKFFPRTPGIGSYTGLTLLCCYVVGRLARRFACDTLLPTRTLFIALLPLGFFAALGAGAYSSPFAIGLGLVSFLLFKRCPLNITVTRSCSFLGTSMFAIYLLHTNGLGIGMLQTCERYCHSTLGITSYPMFFLSALAIFSFFLIMDMPRRAFCSIAKRHLTYFYQWIDALYLRFLDLLTRLCEKYIPTSAH